MEVYEFNSARNALRALVREFKIIRMHIPFYLCPVVKNALRQENCQTVFYHIDDNFFPEQDFTGDDFILYPNYFGICTKNVRKLAEKYENLIVDNAHSFYSEYFGFASFNSYRKFFFNCYGLKNGACLSVRKNLKTDYLKDKTTYCAVENNFDYNDFLKNEKSVDEFEILTISDTSSSILKKIDFERDKKERLERFLELSKKYNEVNELNTELEKGEIPFVYPLLTKDEKLAAEITKGNDFIFRYWTNLPESFAEYKFYRYLIPIPLTNLIKHC